MLVFGHNLAVDAVMLIVFPQPLGWASLTAIPAFVLLVLNGAWVALADSVAAWQTLRHLPAGHDFTTIEMKLNVFGAGLPGRELVATARHLHEGRSTHVVEARVHDGDRLVANLVATQFVIPPRG